MEARLWVSTCRTKTLFRRKLHPPSLGTKRGVSLVSLFFSALLGALHDLMTCVERPLTFVAKTVTTCNKHPGQSKTKKRTLPARHPTQFNNGTKYEFHLCSPRSFLLRTNTTGRVTSRPVRRSAPGLHSSPKLLVLSHRCADQQGLQVLQRLRKAIRIAPRGQTPRGRPRAALRSWVDSPWGGRTKSLNKLRAEVTPGDFQSRAMGPKIGSPPGKPGRLKKVPCDIQLLWGWVHGRPVPPCNEQPSR